MMAEDYTVKAHELIDDYEQRYPGTLTGREWLIQAIAEALARAAQPAGEAPDMPAPGA